MLNADHRGTNIENLSEFNREHSPTIPYDFPKDRLPSDMCQNVLTKMLVCVMNSQANRCGPENKAYYQCKRERDAQLFTSIKEWEVEHFAKHQFLKDSKAKVVKSDADGPHSDQQRSYLQNLEDQRVALIQRFESTPQSIANKHLRWRIAADIEQLKWRIDYLSNLDPKEFNESK